MKGSGMFLGEKATASGRAGGGWEVSGRGVGLGLYLKVRQ